VVDLAMKLSPDSMLLSPRSDARDEEILIHSSPELEMKKTPRVINCIFFFPLLTNIHLLKNYLLVYQSFTAD
jgi:hypothetical protein